MAISIGIDIGGSTTKIVGMKNNEVVSPLQVTATDPVTSLFGAFGKFLTDNNMKLTDIKQIAITGVGASYIDRPIYGLPTAIVQEFVAIGLGGLYLSRLTRALIVSMGTGTALVCADSSRAEDDIKHLGGTGIGGGTLLGLSQKMLNIHNIENIMQLSQTGDLGNVDLTVEDISKEVMPSLPKDTTASNFGKNLETATQNDVAKAIVNLVFQSIGTNAVFAVQNRGLEDIVLIGNLSSLQGASEYFKLFTMLHGYKFIIPEYSSFATAVGAAICYKNDRIIKEL